ncbi:MAG: glycosyltransferase, partial [Bowdeniella nasicola]|nr:glycosyltransferase [Bowdeniella nasicola]
TDETPEMLQTTSWPMDVTVRRLKRNTGGAGGFSFGIEAAFAQGYDAFWIMDDDTVPTPTALAELERGMHRFEQRSGSLPSFACSMVVFPDGEVCEMNIPTPTWDWTRDMVHDEDYTLVNSCSFVSCLITAEAVRECGLPYREYFIWFDDVEYTLRLSRFHPGIFVPASRVHHLLPANRGVNFGDVNEKNLWKFQYGVRNQISAAFSLRSPGLAISLAGTMLKQLRGSDVSHKLRMKLLQSAAKGLIFHPKKRFARRIQ